MSGKTIAEQIEEQRIPEKVLVAILRKVAGPMGGCDDPGRCDHMAALQPGERCAVEGCNRTKRKRLGDP